MIRYIFVCSGSWEFKNFKIIYIHRTCLQACVHQLIVELTSKMCAWQPHLMSKSTFFGSEQHIGSLQVNFFIQTWYNYETYCGASEGYVIFGLWSNLVIWRPHLLSKNCGKFFPFGAASLKFADQFIWGVWTLFELVFELRSQMTAWWPHLLSNNVHFFPLGAACQKIVDRFISKWNNCGTYFWGTLFDFRDQIKNDCTVVKNLHICSVRTWITKVYNSICFKLWRITEHILGHVHMTWFLS